ncbi:hypothetical protein Nepgr_022017 [Nepenthes gracilis]|uniref:Uncharacterized protein n=1 Tax=Nepenthes gracilis TaxID=150966 RepID=A0AAD3XXZ3_NEPGR|nr:hypothetical protein Nepgr_022017 [Nepenthes gracilis]
MENVAVEITCGSGLFLFQCLNMVQFQIVAIKSNTDIVLSSNLLLSLSMETQVLFVAVYGVAVSDCAVNCSNGRSTRWPVTVEMSVNAFYDILFLATKGANWSKELILSSNSLNSVSSLGLPALF